MNKFASVRGASVYFCRDEECYRYLILVMILIRILVLIHERTIVQERSEG